MVKTEYGEESMKNVKERTAFGMDFERFCQLDAECNGFNGEFYRNHQIHSEEESFSTFLKKGSESLKNNSTIRGKLC